MKKSTAKVYIHASDTLETLEQVLNKEISVMFKRDLQEENDILDDLCYMRDAVQVARTDMEHRIADAQEAVSSKKGKAK